MDPENGDVFDGEVLSSGPGSAEIRGLDVLDFGRIVVVGQYFGDTNFLGSTATGTGDSDAFALTYERAKGIFLTGLDVVNGSGNARISDVQAVGDSEFIVSGRYENFMSLSGLTLAGSAPGLFYARIFEGDGATWLAGQENGGAVAFADRRLVLDNLGRVEVLVNVPGNGTVRFAGVPLSQSPSAPSGHRQLILDGFEGFLVEDNPVPITGSLGFNSSALTQSGRMVAIGQYNGTFNADGITVSGFGSTDQCVVRLATDTGGNFDPPPRGGGQF